MVESDLRHIQSDVVEWADSTFPGRNIQSTIKKLKEEMVELANDPSDGMEMADVIILIADIANHYGVDLPTAIDVKMRINKKRRWHEDDTGVMRHVE